MRKNQTPINSVEAYACNCDCSCECECYCTCGSSGFETAYNRDRTNHPTATMRAALTTDFVSYDRDKPR